MKTFLIVFIDWESNSVKLEERKNYPWILVVSYSLLGVCFPAAVTQFSMVVDTLAAQMNLPQQTIMMADSLRAVCLVLQCFVPALYIVN